MRRVAHGTVYFPPPASERVAHLMKVQSSAVRTAYQFMRRTKHTGNEVKKHVKIRYMAELNQRYVGDACGIASQMRGVPSVIFGGKRAWKDLQEGRLTKEQWQARRNAMLYSRGDKTKNGNPNIRIVGNKVLVNDPSKRGLWLEGKLFLPAKFKPNWSCYDVRLKRCEDGVTKVMISWDEEPAPVVTASISQGVLGVDCNPDGLGVTETDAHGNLRHQHYEKEQRIQFSRAGKRTHDVRMLAVRLVAFAAVVGKPIVLEKLRFWHGKQQGKKFNRMRHNFLHRQMLEALKSRAEKVGVEVVEVEPAFTSILGKLKYQDMYSLKSHTAAAMVIARRGMGFVERQTFTDTLRGLGGSRVDLEGDTRLHTLKPKAWSWMRGCFLRPKNSRAHSPVSGSGNSAGIGDNPGASRRDESGSTTGRSRHPASAEVLVVDEMTTVEVFPTS